MDDSTRSLRARLLGVQGVWFSHAKRWWFICLLSQIAVVTYGAFVSMYQLGSPWNASLVGVVSVLAQLGLWRSAVLRARGEDALRHIEFEDGFGWKVEEGDLADCLAKAVRIEASAKVREEEHGQFFASLEDVGPKRALENLHESSWWTYQLASRMVPISSVGLVALLLLTIFGLVSAVAHSGSALAPYAVVTATLTVVFAGNLVRLPIEYSRLSHMAKEVSGRAQRLSKATLVRNEDAVRVLGDYQSKRAGAPLIPDVLWRRRRDALNQIWQQTRSQGSRPNG